MKHTCREALAAVLFFTQAAIAAQPPDAGQMLESIKPPPSLPPASSGVLPEQLPARPAMALPADVKVFVKAFRIAGATALAESQLLPLLQDAAGREWSLAELQGLADRLTRHYREHGYLLARAYLPAQEIRDGQVEIAILEGRLGRVTVNNRSLVGDAVAERQLSALQAGEAVQAERLERRLLLVNDLPGVEVRSTLKPGASLGLTDLDISLEAGPRLSGNLEIDNYGNRFTGSTRAGATLALNSPGGLGDTLTLRGLSSGAGMNYGRLAYQLPVGAFGTQAGLAWSQMRYELGGEFKALHSQGDASIVSAYVLQPLLRSRRNNLNGQLTYEHKALNDRVEATSTVTDKTLDVWSLGLSGDRLDGLLGGGATQYSASLVAGNLQLDPTSAALDAAGLSTQGNYSKLAFQLVRVQRLTDSVSLKGQLSGQAAGKNLDSSEKFTLGGAYGVRAYPQGEAAADDAWLVNLELRYSPAQDWQLSGFYDAGNGRISHSPVTGAANNSRRLSGAGVGLAWSKPADISLQAFVAWRTAGEPTSDHDRSPRLWLQAVKYF